MKSSGNGVASLIQLDCKSNIDTIMYGNATGNTPFSHTYVQHTPFDRTIESQTKTFLPNDHFTFEIPSKDQDMIGNLMLEIHLPDLPDNYVYNNHIAQSLIQRIRLYQENEYAVFTGHYLHLLYRHKRKTNGLQAMNGSYNTIFSLHGKKRIVYIDIPFLKSFNDIQFMPTSSSNQLNFRIDVEIEPMNRILKRIVKESEPEIKINSYYQKDKVRFTFTTNDIQDIAPPNMKCVLLYDSVTLSDRERNLFSTKSSKIMFQQVQYREQSILTNETVKNIIIRYQHSVSHLLLTLEHDTTEPLKFLPIDTIQIILNGVIVNTDTTNADIYRLKGEYYCNTYIYAIPFCLTRSTTQPSGTFSFSGGVRNTITDDLQFPSNQHEIKITR